MNTSPRLGVAVMVVDSQYRLLLGRRGKDPNRGKWVIPGGGVEFGETLIEAAKREIKEETGLEISVLPHPPIVVEVIHDDEHRVILFLRGKVVDPLVTPRAGSDLISPAFVHLDNIKHLALSPVVAPVLRETGWLPKES